MIQRIRIPGPADGNVHKSCDARSALVAQPALAGFTGTCLRGPSLR